MNKKILTEADIRTKFITPAIVGDSGGKWDVMTQVREEVYFTKGRVIVRGKTVRRGEARKADYVLYYKPNIPIAVIEAKDNTYAVGAGMQQALDYAEALDVPFAISCNGDTFLEHDRIGKAGAVERETPLDQFPSAQELWANPPTRTATASFAPSAQAFGRLQAAPRRHQRSDHAPDQGVRVSGGDAADGGTDAGRGEDQKEEARVLYVAAMVTTQRLVIVAVGVRVWAEAYGAAG